MKKSNFYNKFLVGYSKIEKPVIMLILAELFLQFINSSFFLLLNYYMTDSDYEDYMIADIISYRFLTVMFFAFPLGLFIKGRNLKPFFLVATLVVPLCSLVVLHAIEMRWDTVLYIALSIWGVGFTLIQVCALPFILLNSKKETHSETIVLFFQTWSISICIIGFLNFTLQTFLPQIFDERLLLNIFSLIGFLSFFCILKMDLKENVSNRNGMKDWLGNYDWKTIFLVIVPTFIIAVGAGFTIPFINLFFLYVHNVPSAVYSAMGSFSYMIVAGGVLFMPFIRKKYGYKIAIVLIQSLSIVALIVMALTEYVAAYGFAVYIAVLFFIIRQPLMNVAGPMTSELTMYYVGERNREIVSAINASIWSGSWFISSQIFSILRSRGFQYSEIFFITAALYAVGVIWYYFLIKDFYKKKGTGEL
ncbi:MAG: MFS transporter [Chitinophagaceae bacterium]|nr:MAG: MFS transporter [Chitinophagaceae bacterium]